jgi:hypothetical protein
MNSRAHEVLFESEAALRMVDQEIDEFRGASPSEPRQADVGLIDACVRASGLVDALEAVDQLDSPDRATASALRASLRAEIDQMMDALQSREITSNRSSAD